MRFVIEFKTPTGMLFPPTTYNIERFIAFGGAFPYSIFSESLSESSIFCPSLLVVSIFVSEDISDEPSDSITCIIAEFAIS